MGDAGIFELGEGDGADSDRPREAVREGPTSRTGQVRKGGRGPELVAVLHDFQPRPFRMRSSSRRHKLMMVFTNEATRDDAVKKSYTFVITTAP